VLPDAPRIDTRSSIRWRLSFSAGLAAAGFIEETGARSPVKFHDACEHLVALGNIAGTFQPRSVEV
jgi:hypothetical protein